MSQLTAEIAALREREQKALKAFKVTSAKADELTCTITRLTARVNELEDLLKRSNKAARLEDLARITEQDRIIKAWEDERIWLAWDDYRGAKQLRTLTADKCRVLRHNTPAEAYAALEKDGE